MKASWMSTSERHGFGAQKENPAKGGVSRLLVGRVALFPLREEALLTNESCLRNLVGQATTYQLVD